MTSPFIRRLEKVGTLSDLEYELLLSLVLEHQEVAAHHDLVSQNCDRSFLLTSGHAAAR